MDGQRTPACWTVEEYRTLTGTSRIRVFFNGLGQENKKIARNLLKLLEEFGNAVEPPGV
jgi:hypothetical protein